MKKTNLARQKFYSSLFKLLWEEVKTLNLGKVRSLSIVGLRYLLMRWAFYSSRRQFFLFSTPSTKNP